LDTLTPGLAALAICLGISSLASGATYGTPTDLPWAIYLWGEHRHPIQVYEIILFTLLLGIILANKKQWAAAKPGMLFFVFLGSGSAIYIFVEAFRGDSQLFQTTFRTFQLIAWLVLAMSLWGISKRLEKNHRKPPQYLGD
jgi:prolipoprotein diacylglyceryltransferase